MTIERYNYNDEPSGRSETLVQALDRCERLEKQLQGIKTVYGVSVESIIKLKIIAEEKGYKNLDDFIKELEK